LWAAAGLAVGLSVAFLVYLDSHRGAVIALPSSPTPAPRVPDVARKPPEPPSRPAEEPGESRFQFYKMLPEMQVPPAGGAPAGEVSAVPAQPRPSGETYMLQVGAFRTYQEADRLKASLTLLGLEVSIQTVSQEGKGSLHRVRVGPFTEMSAVNQARRRLKQQSLDPILVKAKT
jgi:cell division protein FtsN